MLFMNFREGEGKRICSCLTYEVAITGYGVVIALHIPPVMYGKVKWRKEVTPTYVQSRCFKVSNFPSNRLQ